MGRISVIRRQQMMAAEIENLRRERIYLRGALAEICQLDDVHEMRKLALKTLVLVQPAPAWDDPDDAALPDPPITPDDRVMAAHRAAWMKTAKDH